MSIQGDIYEEREEALKLDFEKRLKDLTTQHELLEQELNARQARDKESPSVPAGPKVTIAAIAFLWYPDQKGFIVHEHPKRGWEVPGGKVEPGESAFEAMLREVKEEVGEFDTMSFDNREPECGMWSDFEGGLTYVYTYRGRVYLPKQPVTTMCLDDLLSKGWSAPFYRTFMATSGCLFVDGKARQ